MNLLKLAREFNTRAMGVQDVTALGNITGTVLAELLRIPRSGLMVFTPEGANFTVRWVTARGDFPAPLPELSRNNLLFQHLSRQHTPFKHSDLEDDLRYGSIPKPEQEWLKQLAAAAYVPLLSSGALGGVLVVGFTGRGKLDDEQMEALTLMGELVGPTLRAVRALETVKQLSAAPPPEPAPEPEPAPVAASAHNGVPLNAITTDFLTVISHELRTPTNQLLGFAELLRAMAEEDKFDAPSINDITQNILRACARLNTVISQMLDMAEIDLNTFGLHYDDVTLDEVLQLAVEPYRKAVQERRLILNILGAPAIPPMRADKLRLAQAFSQITSNSIKFTPDGGRIDIGSRMLPPEGAGSARVEIVFVDSGIGIASENKDLIFEKFFRVGKVDQHTTSNTKFMGGGPGLGLAVAKGIIEAHGGKIWAESVGHDPQKLPGSRFHVILPLLPPTPRMATRPLGAQAGPNSLTDTRPRKKLGPFTGMS